MFNAIWIFISALAIAWIAPMVAHSIKLAEFRQAWIIDLRKDISDYVGVCRRWIRIYDDINGLKSDDPLKSQRERTELFPTANEALVILWRIKLRINPRENEHSKEDEALIAALGDLLNPGKVPPSVSDMESSWRNLAEKAVEQGREVLKREWEVTKRAPLARSIATASSKVHAWFQPKTF